MSSPDRYFAALNKSSERFTSVKRGDPRSEGASGTYHKGGMEQLTRVKRGDTRNKAASSCPCEGRTLAIYCFKTANCLLISTIMVSCLHFGQKSGKFSRTVALRIFTRVLFPQIGHKTHSNALIVPPSFW